MVVPRPSLGTTAPPPPPAPAAPTAGDGDRPRSRTGPVLLVLALVAIGALVVGVLAATGDDDEGSARPVTTLERQRATTSTTRRATTTTTSATSTTAPTGIVAGTPSKPGDDPTLDALHARCGNADYAACDTLYRRAAAGTEYRRFGDTCGGRNDSAGFCTEIYDTSDDDAVVTGAPEDYGDDPHLDALWDGCRTGDWASCDRLYYESGAGTRYEEYGDTCGYRNEPSGLCTELYG